MTGQEIPEYMQQAAKQIIEEALGKERVRGPWSPRERRLVFDLCDYLLMLVEEDKKTRNRPGTLAGTGPVPRETPTPSDESAEGSGHCER
jgi:hypothetical protein